MYQVLHMVKELSCEVLSVDNYEPLPFNWIIVLKQLQCLAVLLQLLMHLCTSLTASAVTCFDERVLMLKVHST